MEEKQKAKELILSFYRYAKGQTNEARLINAKFSAIKCADEIQKEHNPPWMMSDERWSYWQKVKTEIQNYES
jgi:hypothetical protein